MTSEIELGDVVKDIYCGFVGVAISRSEFINGCVQYGVVAKCESGTEPKEVAIDSESLIVIEKKPAPKPIKENGGPMRRAPKPGGY